MVEKDKTLVRLAELGDAEAQLDLGDEYSFNKEYQKAEYWYNKSAKQGNVQAQIALAILYGHSIKNLSKSAYWWEKAAEQGDSQAQFEIGRMYEFAQGVLRDRDKAIYWWTKAAEQEHEIAEYYLGCYNKDRYLTTKDKADKEKGLYWLKRAYEHGNEQAQTIYFMLLFHN